MVEKAEGTASLEKALDVLEAIGSYPKGLSQVDLGQRLGLPRTTLYRLLATLTERGLIRRDAHRRVYCLGFKCFEYARQAHAMPDLAAAANSEMRSLRDLTGETCYLAVLDGFEVLALEKVEGAHSKRSNSRLGERKPLHCTSQGKAILSAVPDDERERLLKGIALRPVTELSITDKRRLASEIKITRARGYSIDDEEMVMGIRCVGAPIVDPKGQVRGAISVAGPKWRMTRERLDILGPEILEAARRIGAELPVQSSSSTTIEAEAVEGPWAFQGMYPRWSERNQALFWIDTLAPSLRVYIDNVDKELCKFEHPVTGLAIDQNDQLVVTFDAGYLQIEKPLGKLKVSALHPWEEGTPSALTQARDGSLYLCRKSQNGRWQVGSWLPGESYSAQWSLNQQLNALAWNQSSEKLYGLNSETGEIVVMTPQQNNVRRVANISKGSGRASGLCIDQFEGIWTTLQDGWGAIRLTDEGNTDRVLSLPIPTPTDVAVCSDRLYITSSRQSLSMEATANAPLSGRLFTATIHA